MSDRTAAAIRARHLLTTLHAKQFEAVEPSLGEFGVVSDVSGDLVAVRLTRDSNAATQLLARVAGPSVVAGDAVALMPMRGGGFVAMKLGGAQIPTPIQDGQVNIRTSSGTAFTIETSGGADYLLVDTSNGILKAENALDWRGYSDAAEAVQEWEIDGATGRAHFSGGIEVGLGESIFGGSIQGGRYVYLSNSVPVGTLAGVTLTANRMYYQLVYIARSITCDAFSYEITTAVSGSVQCGLYACSSSITPGDRLVLGSKTAQSTVGVKTQTHTGVVIEGGRWYFVGLCSTVAMAIRGSTVTNNLISPRGGAGTSDHYVMASEDLAAGWSNIPATASAGSQGNMYLHVGARNA